MFKHSAVSTVFITLFICIFCALAWAGSSVDNTFDIETREIENRKKGPPKFKLVRFTHQKHIQDYQIACGDCHHDDSNRPLDLQPGDTVQRCVECHTGLTKDKKNRKDIMVLENAMHDNCISCHKKFNMQQGDPKGMKGPAPASCGKCHIPLKTK